MAAGWRNPKFDLKEKSKVVFEQALALSLALASMILLTYQEFQIQAYEGGGETKTIEVEDIPETQQLKKPPPPQRPQIPIASADEDIPDDVTIMDTEIDLDAPPPPPPPPPGAKKKEESPIFMAYEEAPVLTKMVQPKYPEIARKAGVEGKVVMSIVVDEEGNVIDAEVIVAQPPGIFEEAAKEAIMQWKYKPAKQRDKAVKVRVGQTVEFTLHKKPPLD